MRQHLLMNKRKSFAIILSAPILVVTAVAYAQTRYDPPTLVVTKPAQPAPTIAVTSALHVPFTNFDLTARGADIIVHEVVVQKGGISDSGVFGDIVLLDSKGEELGSDSLNSDDEAHFTDDIYIPQNTTLHLTVAANMADDLTEFDGQMPNL